MPAAPDWTVETDLQTVRKQYPDPLRALAEARVPAFVLRQAYDPAHCEGLIRRFIDQGLMRDPWDTSGKDTRSRIDIGTSLGNLGADQERFLQHAAGTHQLFSTLFAGFGDPVQTIYAALQGLAGNHQVMVAREPDGRQYGPAIFASTTAAIPIAPIDHVVCKNSVSTTRSRYHRSPGYCVSERRPPGRERRPSCTNACGHPSSPHRRRDLSPVRGGKQHRPVPGRPGTGISTSSIPLHPRVPPSRETCPAWSAVFIDLTRTPGSVCWCDFAINPCLTTAPRPGAPTARRKYLPGPGCSKFGPTPILEDLCAVTEVAGDRIFSVILLISGSQGWFTMINFSVEVYADEPFERRCGSSRSRQKTGLLRT